MLLQLAKTFECGIRLKHFLSEQGSHDFQRNRGDLVIRFGLPTGPSFQVFHQDPLQGPVDTPDLQDAMVARVLHATGCEVGEPGIDPNVVRGAVEQAITADTRHKNGEEHL